MNSMKTPSAMNDTSAASKERQQQQQQQQQRQQQQQQQYPKQQREKETAPPPSQSASSAPTLNTNIVQTVFPVGIQLENGGFNIRRVMGNAKSAFVDVDPFLLVDHYCWPHAPPPQLPQQSSVFTAFDSISDSNIILAGSGINPLKGYSVILYQVSGDLDVVFPDSTRYTLKEGQLMYECAPAGIVQGYQIMERAVRSNCGKPIFGIHLWVKLPASMIAKCQQQQQQQRQQQQQTPYLQPLHKQTHARSQSRSQSQKQQSQQQQQQQQQQSGGNQLMPSIPEAQNQQARPRSITLASLKRPASIWLPFINIKSTSVSPVTSTGIPITTVASEPIDSHHLQQQLSQISINSSGSNGSTNTNTNVNANVNANTNTTTGISNSNSNTLAKPIHSSRLSALISNRTHRRAATAATVPADLVGLSSGTATAPDVQIVMTTMSEHTPDSTSSIGGLPVSRASLTDPCSSISENDMIGQPMNMHSSPSPSLGLQVPRQTSPAPLLSLHPQPIESFMAVSQVSEHPVIRSPDGCTLVRFIVGGGLGFNAPATVHKPSQPTRFQKLFRNTSLTSTRSGGGSGSSDKSQCSSTASAPLIDATQHPASVHPGEDQVSALPSEAAFTSQVIRSPPLQLPSVLGGGQPSCQQPNVTMTASAPAPTTSYPISRTSSLSISLLSPNPVPFPLQPQHLQPCPNRAPIPTVTPVHVLEVEIAPGAQPFELMVPCGLRGIAYTFGGRTPMHIGQRSIPLYHSAVIDTMSAVPALSSSPRSGRNNRSSPDPAGLGDSVALRLVAADSSQSSRAIIVLGPPVGEPIVRCGPLVLSSQEDIVEALVDYSQDRFDKSVPLYMYSKGVPNLMKKPSVRYAMLSASSTPKTTTASSPSSSAAGVAAGVTAGAISSGAKNVMVNRVNSGGGTKKISAVVLPATGSAGSIDGSSIASSTFSGFKLVNRIFRSRSSVMPSELLKSANQIDQNQKQSSTKQRTRAVTTDAATTVSTSQISQIAPIEARANTTLLEITPENCKVCTELGIDVTSPSQVSTGSASPQPSQSAVKRAIDFILRRHNAN